MMSDVKWDEILETLRPANRLLAQTWAPNDPQIAAELHRQLMMNLSLGYLLYFHNDPHYPDFIPFLNSAFLLQPNPDDTYFLAHIEGTGTYRVSGDRGSVHLLTATLTNKMMGVDEQLAPLLAEYDIGAMAAPHGKLDLIFSATKPAGHSGHWLALDPRARFLMVRQRSYDWGAEGDARLAIERLDDVPAQGRMSAGDIATRVAGVTAFAERLSRFWLGHQQRLRETVPVNTIRFSPFANQGGVRVQAYWEAIFEYEADEVLILESELPIKRPYWNVQLNDTLFNTIDYVWHQSSLNGHQAKVDADGKFRAVIAATDPGVANWLDTMGHLSGTVIGRWYDCDSQPMPVLKRVKLADLAAHLPPDTARVSTADRKATVHARARGAQRRRRW
jgi:Protein of unknown function (DUF1214)